MKIVFDKQFLKELEILECENIKRWDKETEAYLLKIMEVTNSTKKAMDLLNKFFPDRNFTYDSVEHKMRRLKSNLLKNKEKEK